MDVALFLTVTVVALGIPLAILTALFTSRTRKLRKAEEVARRALEPIARALATDDRVTVTARVGRAENELYFQRGQGPLNGTLRVQVDLRGLDVPLRLRPRRMVSMAGARQKLGLLNDVEVGSAAFDEEWIVESDPALAKAVLTPEMTARLNALLAELPDLARIEVGPNGLAIEWTGLLLGAYSFWGLRGLDPTWTTKIPSDTVGRARDALLELRDRILGHAEERALAGVAGGTYRRPEAVRVEPAPEPVRVEPDPEPVRVQLDEEPVERAPDEVPRRARTS